MDARLQEFIGKRVSVNLEKLSDEEVEFDWFYDFSHPLLKGSGHINLDYRPYKSTDSFDLDDMDEDDDDDDGFDETDNWMLQTGIDLSTDEKGFIASLDITANVSSFGDSGLGDCDPRDMWTSKDYDLARSFLYSITNNERTRKKESSKK